MIINSKIEEYLGLINDYNTTENDVQRYLENNTEMIPLPFLLNHSLHFNSIISKYPISTSYICDFAYITKSTVGWEVVFIEIESPKKNIFLADDKNIAFTSDFNKAVDQVMSWKAYISCNGDIIKRSLATLLRPIQMANNPISYKYVLIIGRNNDVLRSQAHTNMFRLKNTEDFRVLTYDSIANYTNSFIRTWKHNILVRVKEQYAIKHLDSFDTPIFAYLNKHELILTDEQKKVLECEGFEIAKWMNGEYLTINNTRASSSMKQVIKETLGSFQD